MTQFLREALDFAIETAYLAGRLTLGYFHTGVQVEFKGDHTPVTVADREAETLIRHRIGQRFPRAAILGEEYGAQGPGGASQCWLVDPIDGTRSFTRGVPLYATLIGLEIDGRVRVGVAYFPALDELLAAADGLGCWWNGRRAHVSPVRTLQRATVSCSDPGSFDAHGRGAAWARIREATYFRAGWGDAYGHMLVATGRIELMLDPIMSPWDCGPFPPIMREAGGYFGNWSGEPTIYAGEALSTTPALLPQVLALIAEPQEDQPAS